jgi:ketosteroid isomerase-like protein
MRRSAIAALGFVLLVAMAGPACGSEKEWVASGAAATHGNQVDLGRLFEREIDALNGGDVDAAMELFADDAVLTVIPVCYPAPCTGKDSIRNMMDYIIAENVHTTIAHMEVSQNTVMASVTVASDDTRAMGLTEVLAWHVVEYRDGRISRQLVTFELTRPAGVGMIRNFIDVELGPGRDADQTPGAATLAWFGERTTVAVTVPPGPAGVSQPANIYEGTCSDLGAVAFPLEDIRGGKSGTGFAFPLSDLRTGGFAIAIQKSHDEPEVFVACGDIPAAGAE